MNTLSIARPMLSLAILAPTAAIAHTGEHSASGFVSGILHPFLGLDHLLAMLAVGIVAAQQSGKARITLPAVFAGVMLIGTTAGVTGMTLPYMESGILVSVMVLGLIALAAIPMQSRFSGALIAAFALFHGLAHGNELPATASIATYFFGFCLATILIQASALMSATHLSKSKGNLLNRLAGASILMGGVALTAA